MAKALVIGATGLIGRELVQMLINDYHFSEIEIWVRKSSFITNSKITEKVIDFNSISQIGKIHHDVVFCTVGTTIKKAGSKENFRAVDYDIPVEAARLAERSNVTSFIVVSSLGASSSTGNFYLKTKGEMEDAVKDLVIPSITILRPSVLIGNRVEFRLGEKIAIYLLKLFGFLMIGGMKKFRGISAANVAKAMIVLSSDEWLGLNIIESDEIERIANL